MNLDPHVAHLSRELQVAAAGGGEEARALAERLTAPLDSAVRLVLLEALAEAAEEITRDLAPGSVEVRLRGREPAFAVVPPEPVAAEPARSYPPAAPPPDGAGGEESATSRLTVRLPEHLKARIESAAADEGVSLNTWLVRAASAALGSGPGAGESSNPWWTAGPDHGGRQYTGWVR